VSSEQQATLILVLLFYDGRLGPALDFSVSEVQGMGRFKNEQSRKNEGIFHASLQCGRANPTD